jgi:hypothetical protein
LGWLHNDSRGAAAFAAAHADDSDVKQALGEFGRALFARSRDEATAFIQSLPNEDAQRATLDELLQDVRGVIRMTEGGDEEEPEEAEVARGEIPPWLVTLPANLWNEHAAEIFECWDAADASRAERWLRTLPSDIRSKAIVDYCASAPIEKAARVFELSAFLNEAEVRNSLLQKFVDNVSRDPSEARNKIAALPLTDQQKHALLSRVRDNR